MSFSLGRSSLPQSFISSCFQTGSFQKQHLSEAQCCPGKRPTLLSSWGHTDLHLQSSRAPVLGLRVRDVHGSCGAAMEIFLGPYRRWHQPLFHILCGFTLKGHMLMRFRFIETQITKKVFIIFMCVLVQWQVWTNLSCSTWWGQVAVE